MANIDDIASAASSIFSWAGESSNMDEIDFDVTAHRNGPTTNFRYDYKESENEMLIRSGNRWGRVKAEDVEGASGGGNALSLTDEQLETFDNNGSVVLTPEQVGIITDVIDGGYKEIIINGSMLPVWGATPRSLFMIDDPDSDWAGALAIFGDSFSFDIGATYFILPDENENAYYLVETPGYGYFPAGVLPIHFDNIPDDQWLEVPVSGEFPDFIAQYPSIQIVGDRLNYPKYSNDQRSDAISALYDAGIISDNHEDGPYLFFGDISQDGGDYVENGAQFIVSLREAIITDNTLAPVIMMVRDISGWTESGNQGGLLH